MFKICDGKGFHITFENGYTISVQFGWANYSDNYDYDGDGERDFTIRNQRAGKLGSSTAECAVLKPGGGLIELPAEFSEGDTVTNRTRPDDVLKLMNWASSLPKS